MLINQYIVKMKTETKKRSARQLKALAKKMHPNAVKIELGSNNITNGIWIEEENAKYRIFIPA